MTARMTAKPKTMKIMGNHFFVRAAFRLRCPGRFAFGRMRNRIAASKFVGVGHGLSRMDARL